MQKQIDGYRDSRKRRSEQAAKVQKAAQEQAGTMQAEMLARMDGLDRAGKGFDELRPEIGDTLAKR